MIVKFYVNFVRLWFLVGWSNTSLDIAMKIFCGSDLHLKSFDFKKRRLSSIIYMGLILSVEGL